MLNIKNNYVGGLQAAIYWGLTDFTQQEGLDHLSITIKTSNSKLHSNIFNGEATRFGLQLETFNNSSVLISDPTRTTLDLINKPTLMASLGDVEKTFTNYLASNYKDLSLMMKYADAYNSGALFKRLGFLVERHAPAEQDLITHCAKKISRGYSRLDSRLLSEKIISKWRLWIPESYK